MEPGPRIEHFIPLKSSKRRAPSALHSVPTHQAKLIGRTCLTCRETIPRPTHSYATAWFRPHVQAQSQPDRLGNTSPERHHAPPDSAQGPQRGWFQCLQPEPGTAFPECAQPAQHGAVAPGQNQSSRNNSAIMQQSSNYATIQQLRNNSAITQQFSNYARIQQLRKNSAITQDFCNYARILQLRKNWAIIIANVLPL